MLSDNGLTS